LRSWAPVPAFLFASIAASGIAADILKVVCGRTRPELLFAADLYRFGGFAWHADHWSFPSGHAATIVSLAMALWHLWPSHLLFYATIAITVSASRVVVGAHFFSDTIAGAWLAVLTTRGVVLLFARAGVDVATWNRRFPAEGEPPRVCRRFAGVAKLRASRGPPADPAAGLHRRRGL
jgi:membrane-associated phospholipid phosphatase